MQTRLGRSLIFMQTTCPVAAHDPSPVTSVTAVIKWKGVKRAARQDQGGIELQFAALPVQASRKKLLFGNEKT
jgi:hypothetical protein